MNFSIGEEIKKRVKESGLTNVAFAEKMNMAERNLYHFFNKKDMSLDQLVDASHVLGFDFIKLYLEHSPKKDKLLPSMKSICGEPDGEYTRRKKIKHEISFSVTVSGELETIQHEFTNFLSVMKKEADSRGLALK